MNLFDKISVAAFQSQFLRDFPYLPMWQAGKVYFKDDIVFANSNFYTSLIDNNTASVSDAAKWQITNESEQNYVSDNDILKAFSEAKINFNYNFFECINDAEMVFYYLAAHYLVIDLNNAMSALALGVMGYTTSKSVGSVSESYGIPQWMLNNPALSGYAQTGYGRKYLSLIMPYLSGQLILTPGRTTFG